MTPLSSSSYAQYRFVKVFSSLFDVFDVKDLHAAHAAGDDRFSLLKKYLLAKNTIYRL